MKYTIEVREIGTDALVRTIGPYSSERLVDRAEQGVWRQMDLDNYYTAVVALEGQ